MVGDGHVHTCLLFGLHFPEISAGLHFPAPSTYRSQSPDYWFSSLVHNPPHVTEVFWFPYFSCEINAQCLCCPMITVVFMVLTNVLSYDFCFLGYISFIGCMCLAWPLPVYLLWSLFHILDLSTQSIWIKPLPAHISVCSLHSWQWLSDPVNVHNVNTEFAGQGWLFIVI